MAEAAGRRPSKEKNAAACMAEPEARVHLGAMLTLLPMAPSPKKRSRGVRACDSKFNKPKNCSGAAALAEAKLQIGGYPVRLLDSGSSNVSRSA
jgi:hypothetical protein